MIWSILMIQHFWITCWSKSGYKRNCERIRSTLSGAFMMLMCLNILQYGVRTQSYLCKFTSQLLKHFFTLSRGKCFGPSTRATRFLTQMPYLFIIKICFAIKVNSIYGAGRDTRNLCHKFSYKGSALRILGLRVTSRNSNGPSSGVLGARVSCPRVLGVRVPDSQGTRSQSSHGPRVFRSQVSGSRASRSQNPGSGSQVLILDYDNIGNMPKPFIYFSSLFIIEDLFNR